MSDIDDGRTRASYDAVAAEYAAAFADELDRKPFDRAQLDCLVELTRNGEDRNDEDGTHENGKDAGGNGEDRDGADGGASNGSGAGTVGPVADIGCGPGHIAAYLASRGADTIGVDLSPGMIAEASRRHPGLVFRVGSMLDLPIPDGRLAGAACFYAIIHLDADGRRRAYAEFARVIARGGWLLVAFHVSDAEREPGEVANVNDFLGRPVDLDFHFLDPREVADGLRAAGFQEMVHSIRRPWPGVEHSSRRAYLLVRRG